MFHRHSAFVAAAVFAAAGSVANAALTIDLRVAGATDSKSVQVENVGDVVTLNVYAVVKGANSTIDTDGLQSITGSFVSTPVSGSPVGNFSVFSPVAPFNGTVLAGTVQDLNGLPGLDLGGTGTNAAGGRSLQMQIGNGAPVVGDAAASEWLIGTVSWTVTNAEGLDATTLSFIPLAGASSALWREDGANRNGSTGSFVGGSPVSVTAIPEPASLAVVGMAAASLLRRRRTA